MKLDSNHCSFNGRYCFFCGFRNYVKTFVIHFVKHIYSIQAIILIRLIRLQGISKYPFLFADKFMSTQLCSLVYASHSPPIRSSALDGSTSLSVENKPFVTQTE